MMPRRRWLVTGATGQLGGHVLRQLSQRVGTANILALTRVEYHQISGARVARVELADEHLLRTCVADFRPTNIVHAGAMTAVSDCYTHPAEAERVNTAATRVLAEAAAQCGARLVFTSTDMVFAGDAAPYHETDSPRPLSHYGRTKAAAERCLAGFEQALTVRLPLMYGFACTKRDTTFARQIAALRSGKPQRLFIDEYRTPLWLADAAAALIALAHSDLTGLIHVAGPERLSRFDMVERFARLLRIRDARLEPASRLSVESAEPRPEDLSLDGWRFAGSFPSLVPRAICAEALAEPT